MAILHLWLEDEDDGEDDDDDDDVKPSVLGSFKKLKKVSWFKKPSTRFFQEFFESS